MKVKDLVATLSEYNPEADVVAVSHNRSHEFSISYGGSDGVTKEKCETVNICIDKINSSDATS